MDLALTNVAAGYLPLFGFAVWAIELEGLVHSCQGFSQLPHELYHQPFFFLDRVSLSPPG